MQLGMVGLGRMGAGLVRRLMRDGHTLRRLRRLPGRGQGAGGGRRDRRDFARGVRREAREARAAWVMVPAGEITDKTIADARRRARATATRSSTAATATTATTSGAPAALAREGHPPRRRRHERRRLGLERGFCLMIGGETEVVDAARPDLRARSRPASTPRRARRAATGEPRTAEHGYLPLRPERRRPLREDGAQRHRVRADGRVRRGPQHPRATPTSASASATTDAETAPLRAPRVLPVRHRHRRGRRGLAPRQRRRLVAARPHRGRRCTSRRRSRSSPAASPTPARAAGRRSPRSRTAFLRPVLTTALVLALRLARHGRLREQAPLRDAQAVRRPRREGEPDAALEIEVLARRGRRRRAWR